MHIDFFAISNNGETKKKKKNIYHEIKSQPNAKKVSISFIISTTIPASRASIVSLI